MRRAGKILRFPRPPAEPEYHGTNWKGVAGMLIMALTALGSLTFLWWLTGKSFGADHGA